jgi:putative ATP-dependent endonuclease of OLD family
LVVKNFRNFQGVDIPLGAHVVIVGENKSGKSNLAYALRLVLDPSLPDSARYLRVEDFWDGLPRPLKGTEEVEIAVELTGWDTDPNLLAVLGSFVSQAAPPTARLTYRFRPRPAPKDAAKSALADYEFLVHGGVKEELRVTHEIRRRLPLEFLHALRDAEGDLESWRRSPLRPLLDAAVAGIPDKDLDAVAEAVTEAASVITGLAPIKKVGEQLDHRLEQIVGPKHAVDATLGVAPTNASRLLRTLRLLIDNGSRGIGDASLGTANLVYLALKTLEIEERAHSEERDHTFLVMDEPEAHLHPHVQRLVYRDLLRSSGSPRTVILTTHSPHVASVAPLRSLVLLRRKGATSTATSTADVVLDAKDADDLQRYLDVTRAELVFGRGVLLVEGDAEKFIVPVLARRLGYDLDALGVTVCSVAGTHFGPYWRFLRKLNIPAAVLTDRDPAVSGGTLGLERARKLLSEEVGVEAAAALDGAQILAAAAKRGVFVNEYTLEADIFDAGMHKSTCQALKELADSPTVVQRADSWMAEPAKCNKTQLLKDVSAIGKGRFAQRLAAILGVRKGKSCPMYIQRGVEFVAKGIEQ